MAQLLKIIDATSNGLAQLAKLGVVALVLVMCFEVVARYGFNRPTIWSVDITFMLNGAIFILAIAYTQRIDGHIKIDFLSRLLPTRINHGLQAVLLLTLIVPCFLWVGYIAGTKSWAAFLRQERELSSAWGPVVWPYYTALFVGLISLGLQSLAQTMRHLSAAMGYSDASDNE